ncbi:hypothetical protein KIN20_033135 [Parelaphostrongylus tenuis]|uniref:Uncharacterized protein n=1 Tax=Parelaphostrongylus tenuis TaxID=148309 RepID=A0AAD5WI03_PARTN|nr:hypothetical protein KIN20_033135 [Parelaphostrongylus tenuis]
MVIDVRACESFENLHDFSSCDLNLKFYNLFPTVLASINNRNLSTTRLFPSGMLILQCVGLMRSSHKPLPIPFSRALFDKTSIDCN